MRKLFLLATFVLLLAGGAHAQGIGGAYAIWYNLVSQSVTSTSRAELPDASYNDAGKVTLDAYSEVYGPGTKNKGGTATWDFVAYTLVTTPYSSCNVTLNITFGITGYAFVDGDYLIGSSDRVTSFAKAGFYSDTAYATHHALDTEVTFDSGPQTYTVSFSKPFVWDGAYSKVASFSFSSDEIQAKVESIRSISEHLHGWAGAHWQAQMTVTGS